jgi:ribulose-bisphosphate carboxylase large chain
VVNSTSEYLSPLYDQERVPPVVSPGQWGAQVFETYRGTATVDLLYMAGGGIMAHPRGRAPV